MVRRTLLCVLLTTTVVHADDDVGRVDVAPEDADDEPRRNRSGRRYDYSRFSDGPRRVPTPRGRSLQRARSLGLGTRRAADRLLRGRPDPRWVEAAAAGGRSVGEHLRWPVAMGRFGRGFGYVRRTRPNLRHNGVDIVADVGSTVRAVADGIVAYSDNGIRGYGNSVILVHPNGWVSLYAHNYRTTVQPGWRVRQGERIAYVGNTGISRGPHLHFELRVRGRAENPLRHFDGRPWIDAYRQWRRAEAEGTYEPPSEHLLAVLPPDPMTPNHARSPAPTASSAVPNGDATEIGSIAYARRLLGRGATETDLEEVQGDIFSNLLWPVRGGMGADPQPRGVNIPAARGAAVRAAADGLVVFAGEGLSGVGRAVVLLHRNGWVTLYGSNAELHVEVGQQVQRGEWIARVGESGGGTPHLHFQLRDAGASRPPAPLFVQTPAALR